MDEFKTFEKYLKEEKSPKPAPHIHGGNEHIYSRSVRRALCSSAIVMAVGLPLFGHLIQLPLLYGAVLGIIVITFLSGFTNPELKFVMVLDTCIAVLGFFIFESTAIQTYYSTGPANAFFIFNQVLPLFFFIAFYFGTKTLRTFFIISNS